MKKVISTERVPIKLWLDNIEEEALQQAKNLANLPFTFKWVAIMPDSHSGYGMPIGGVLATNGVVVPNAVGVDIGCFSGNTRIPLLDGSIRTLKELYEAGKPIWVYSLNKNHGLVPGKAIALKTRQNAELLRVTISGGEQIICTPDHQFMLLDGTYREAKDLQTMDSLMPFYRTYASRDGYESVITRAGKAVKTHSSIAEAAFGKKSKGSSIHHKNENRWDNRPENLQYMTAIEHDQHPHKRKVDRLKSPEFKKSRLTRLREKGFYRPELAEKKRAVAKENITTYMREQPEHFKKAVAGNGERGKIFLIAYNKSDKGREKSREIGKRNRKEHHNHKVISVHPLEIRADVYCLSVEEYHNFALAAGVFVHNCGMRAVQTNLNDIDVNTIKEILGKTRELISVGFDHNKDDQSWVGFYEAPDIPIIQRELTSAFKQLGTLGGGNHFIEIQKGSDDRIWLMIHSGSRNLGYKTAGEYHKLAQRLSERWYSNIPSNDLAFLPIETPEGREYYEAMKFCLRFAEANRSLMMEKFLGVVKKVTGAAPTDGLDIHHNYAAFEHHYGTNVLVHRKGATKASAGQRGIIPGSMGTPSYIVEGLGNPESFESCSHGAGRKMGRAQAKRTLKLDEEQNKMTGIIHGLRTENELDEAPGAYKDIQLVMENQKDLVKILVKLTPLAVIKG